LAPLSIHDHIQKFRNIGNSRQKKRHIQYMEMSGEDHEKTTKDGNTRTFSFSNINACKYAFNLSNFRFSLQQ
jgi:hypothetical protein